MALHLPIGSVNNIFLVGAGTDANPVPTRPLTDDIVTATMGSIIVGGKEMFYLTTLSTQLWVGADTEIRTQYLPAH